MSLISRVLPIKFIKINNVVNDLNTQVGNQINNSSNISRWAKFSVIMTFILLGLTIIVSLNFDVVAHVYRVVGIHIPQFPFGASVFFIFTSIVLIIPNLYLLRFSNLMKSALRNNKEENIAIALEKLKVYFKIISIILIIEFMFWVLPLLFGMVGIIFGDI